MRRLLQPSGERCNHVDVLRTLSLVIAVIVTLCSTARSVVAQAPGAGIDSTVVVAALAKVDGWLRAGGISAQATVTYSFDEELRQFRPAGGTLVRVATGDSNQWAVSVDHRTGCPLEGSAPGCPRINAGPVVTLGGILRISPGLYSVQFTLSRPPNDAADTRAVEVRLFRIRQQADGRFVREGGVRLLIP